MGLSICCCFGGPCESAKNASERASNRKPRRRSSSAGPRQDTASCRASIDSACLSAYTDGADYHSCCDDFSVCLTTVTSTEGVPLSPVDGGRGSAPSSAASTGVLLKQERNKAMPAEVAAAGASTASAHRHGAGGDAPVEGAFDLLAHVGSSDGGVGDSFCSQQGDRRRGGKAQPGCLGIIESLGARVLAPHPASDAETADSARRRSIQQQQQQQQQQRQGAGRSSSGKPHAGASLNPRDMSRPWTDIVQGYEDGDARHYHVRSLEYMRTKTKVLSAASIYKLVAADVVSSERKQDHIARLVNLPGTPAARHRMSPDSDACFPPLLIFNMQLPAYAPSIFGGSSDGHGWSIVYHFALPDDFDPATFPNQKALALFRRFVQDGKEADGSATRDRLKLIPRVVNVEEWAQKGPLSTAEHRLLVNYNEKPVLARPQTRFFQGPNYLEVVLDLHIYSYVTRVAMIGFMSRLSTVVWESAFVLQGNSEDELPEQVLACARVYRTDFSKAKSFGSLQQAS